MLAVLLIAQCGVSTKSTQARLHADGFAEAASRGWISTQTAPDTFGRTWRLTTSGLATLNIVRGLS